MMRVALAVGARLQTSGHTLAACGARRQPTPRVILSGCATEAKLGGVVVSIIIESTVIAGPRSEAGTARGVAGGGVRPGTEIEVVDETDLPER
jgi:hypothetical protein